MNINANFTKIYITTLFIFLTMSIMASFAVANHKKGTYPTVGHLWMSGDSGYAGWLYVSSNNCNSSEINAFTKIKDSTKGMSYMTDWKDGISMSQVDCSGAWNNNIDIKLNYVSTHPTPGENFDFVNTSSYCSYWNQSYPCGVRSQIKISKAWWSSASSLSKQRLLMHETGHSLGLAHHCTADSVMNDGTSGCNGGKWTSVMSYQSTDRSGVNSIY